MTHPSDASFVNCQQISVLSLPACAVLAPLGSCHDRQQHQGCSPANVPFPDLLPPDSPWQLDSIPAARKASSLSWASVENGWHQIHSLLPAEFEAKNAKAGFEQAWSFLSYILYAL